MSSMLIKLYVPGVMRVPKGNRRKVYVPRGKEYYTDFTKCMTEVKRYRDTSLLKHKVLIFIAHGG